MASKLVKNAPAGTHTAGIFADMTVDGPEIGTLVVIIDRAKNLPNRKSMGKQDPYCAARLGKEAKKTDTDKRGGQTPRWDQELRFTVHDSPDYYRLKVSVFNDDKRTDLIGECWLPLEEIIVRGGGQNDHWHSLNFKGRYAGEIRIELTYYDIRPPESKAEDRKPTPQHSDTPSTGREGITGPRQPKPVGRRPLPSNPTDQKIDLSDQTVSDRPEPHSQRGSVGNSHQHIQVEEPQFSQDEFTQAPSDHTYAGQYKKQVADSGHEAHSLHIDPLHIQQYQPYQAHPSDLSARQSREQLYAEDDDQLFLPKSSSHPPPPPHSAAQNHLYDLQQPQPLRPGNAYTPQTSSTLPTSSSQDYHGSQNSHQPWIEPDHSAWPEIDVDDHDDLGGPPPPPVHRGSVSRAGTDQLYHEPSSYTSNAPQPQGQPRSLRSSISGSPLAQVQYAENPQPYAPSVSPLVSNQDRPYRSQPPSHTSTPQSHHRATHPPGRERGMTTPSSLIAGHDPRSHTLQSFRPQEDGSPSIRPAAQAPSPQFRQEQPSPSLPFYARAPPMSRDMFPTQDNRGHRHSAPLLQHANSSPDPKIPRRKPVLPQSDSLERRSSHIPFSPDSFDAFNPGVASSQVPGNSVKHRYSTPEQAMETAAQHEKETKRGDEPIIGSDGRVIDPSDHLPADTWAPEPETKKRGPEITVRIKPRIPLAEARPNAVSMPNIYAESPRGPAAGRARLQKKSAAMGADYHPNSSPIVPTLDTTARNHAPKHYASDYRIRERENYHYGGSSGSPSPTYTRSAVERAPPPVPGKIPIEREANYWEGDALSEELRSIDIGAGAGGRGSARRRGYGF